MGAAVAEVESVGHASNGWRALGGRPGGGVRLPARLHGWGHRRLAADGPAALPGGAGRGHPLRPAAGPPPRGGADPPPGGPGRPPPRRGRGGGPGLGPPPPPPPRDRPPPFPPPPP